MGSGVPVGSGGTLKLRSERDAYSGIFSVTEFDGSLEAAFLLKSTGIPIAAWTRNPIPQEVMSVMAATLWGSLDTMVRTLGGTGPRSAMLEVEERRLLASQVEPNWTLLLVAPRSVGKRRLRHIAQTVLAELERLRKERAMRQTEVSLSR